MNISNWIDRHADFSPDKAAIHFEGQDISYAGLADRIARLAAGLRDGLGIRRGDRLAYLGPNTPELLELVFAAARIGAILVPLNWRLAPGEHGYILGHCAATALIVDADYFGHAAEIETDLPSDRFIAAGGDHPDWVALEELRNTGALAQGEGAMDDPLLIVYTSGTTGRPKGAVLTQLAILFNAVNATHAHRLTDQDHVLTVLPMFHVGGLNIQTLPALHAGAQVTLHRRFAPDLALRDIAVRRPTLILLVPAVMQAMIEHPNWAGTDLTSIRLMMTGSSAIPEALLRAFADRGTAVAQVYGSTETAPTAIYTPPGDGTAPITSTGKPALHCDVRIVDGQGEDLSANQSGEILVRGPNLMREYWNNPEATAQALRDGWFHTGDVGHRDDDGFYYVDDRKTDMVISGGENIYPAELENVLADCDALAEVAVVGRADDKWGEVPVACVVLRDGHQIDEAAVLDLFKGRLARYKHPRAVMFLPSLPRNVMGKVQKFTLRRLVSETP